MIKEISWIKRLTSIKLMVGVGQIITKVTHIFMKEDK
jgi:hypothetical protein